MRRTAVSSKTKTNKLQQYQQPSAKQPSAKQPSAKQPSAKQPSAKQGGPTRTKSSQQQSPLQQSPVHYHQYPASRMRTSQPPAPPQSIQQPSLFDDFEVRREPDDKEVDFYANPTILSRLIQSQKFSAATARLETNGPAEAFIWVCTKRTLPSSPTAGAPAGSPTSSGFGERYTFRQLPIHMACGNLFRVKDQAARTDLEQLIARLVIAHPDGCARRDHEGRYPLHESIAYSVAPPILSALLMAAPEIAKAKDLYGRLPFTLNEQRQGVSDSDKKLVRSMLKRSPEFWRTARQEAELRMKQRVVPPADATVQSTNVLASSVMDEETLPTRATGPVSPPTGSSVRQQNSVLTPPDRPTTPVTSNTATASSPVIKPTAWSQLEKRATLLEQKLAESFEHMYALTQQLNEVKGSKKELQKKLDKFTSVDLGKRVVQLEREKEDLQFRVARYQSIMLKHGISVEKEDEDLGLPPLVVSVDSTPTVQSDSTPTVQLSSLDSQEREEMERKLVVLKEQLHQLMQHEIDQKEQQEYYENVKLDEYTMHSDITDEFTFMTPASKIKPRRPGPENDNTPTSSSGQRPGQSGELENETFQRSQRRPGSEDDLQQPIQRRPGSEDDLQQPIQRRPGPEEDLEQQIQRRPGPEEDMQQQIQHRPGPEEDMQQQVQRRPGPEEDMQQPMVHQDQPPIVPNNLQSQATMNQQPQQQANGMQMQPQNQSGSSVDDSLYEVDSIIRGAMELNGGRGLSPELLALWKATKLNSQATLSSIPESVQGSDDSPQQLHTAPLGA